MENQENEILYEGGKIMEFFAAADFSNAQMEDETITKVIQLKRKGIALTTSEKSKEYKDVCMLLRDTEKVTLSDDGVLYRHTTDKQQLVLPEKLILIAFTELHVKMGHLGQDHTLQLIRDRFYWPKMETDVKHFMLKVCSCVKSKKPHIEPVAPMQSISSSAIEPVAPMQSISSSAIEPVAPMQSISSSAPLKLIGLDL